MKLFKLAAGFLFAGLPVLFLSCGENKHAEETTVDTTASKPMEAATTPTPVKPPNFLIFTQKVANYAKWKAVYDSRDSARLASGLHNYIIARGSKDSNTVMVALRMDDADKAKAFVESPDRKAAMQKSGVIGTPTYNYLDAQTLDTTTNASTSRVMVTHKVKDWDAWKKEFDTHKQARIDNGLADRAVGYSVGDNHNVTVVCAINDMAKAEAFMKSDDLKQKMEKSGVEGKPNIFFYNVVQKY